MDKKLLDQLKKAFAAAPAAEFLFVCENEVVSNEQQLTGKTYSKIARQQLAAIEELIKSEQKGN